MLKESDAGREGLEGWIRGELRRGALPIEVEHEITFAVVNPTLTIFALTRLAWFGRGSGLMGWGRFWTSLLERFGRSEGINRFR